MPATDSHIVIGSRVPADFADSVRQAAEAEDRSVGYLIRRALRHELERVQGVNGDSAGSAETSDVDVVVCAQPSDARLSRGIPTPEFPSEPPAEARHEEQDDEQHAQRADLDPEDDGVSNHA